MLNEADKARSEMSALQADNERLLQEARAERDGMLREAREMADRLVADAKGKAKEEAAREAESALVKPSPPPSGRRPWLN